MKTSYIAQLPLVFLHTAFIRPPCFLVLQKNNNQNANMNIYYIILSLHFIIFPSNLLPAFIRPSRFLVLHPTLHQCWPLKRGGGVGIRRGWR